MVVFKCRTDVKPWRKANRPDIIPCHTQAFHQTFFLKFDTLEKNVKSIVSKKTPHYHQRLLHPKRRIKHDHRNSPTASRPPRTTRTRLACLSRSPRIGQMDPTLWLHLHRTSSRCPSGRHLQNVLHQFWHRQQPFIRRRIP